MKELKEILKNYKDWETYLEDRFGARLCNFLTPKQAKSIGWRFKDEDAKTHIPKKWTKENILNQLKQDVEFGFEKALNKRGISSWLMYNVVLAWNRILEDGLENWDENNYDLYGLPLFKATAVKYGWDNPIGDDTGSEDKYSECIDE